MAPVMTRDRASAAPELAPGGFENHTRQVVSSAGKDTSVVTGQRTGRPTAVWSTAISFEALSERLGLLFQLEVPCTLHVNGSGSASPRRTSIHRWERCGGRLVFSGPRFSLHLGEEDLEAACVIHWCRNGRLRKVLELRDKKGTLRARILGPCSEEGAAVWHDIMDTFILPTGDVEDQHLEAAH